MENEFFKVSLKVLFLMNDSRREYFFSTRLLAIQERFFADSTIDYKINERKLDDVPRSKFRSRRRRKPSLA